MTVLKGARCARITRTGLKLSLHKVVLRHLIERQLIERQLIKRHLIGTTLDRNDI